jgi:alcohol dehydrogenase
MNIQVDHQSIEIHVMDNVKKLIFGTGSVKKVGEEVERIAGEKATVFFVTDRGIEKAGLADNVRMLLEKEGFKVEVFNDVSVEPTFESIRKATTAIRETKCNVVVGLGGGSVLDTAKTASIMATNPGDVADYFTFLEDRVKQKPLPKILIPTTAGTGSEVSPYVVAIDEGKNEKNFITSPFAIADVSIVDPLMCMTCPPKQTAASGMDALSHAIECFLVSKPTPLSDAYALHAVRLIAENLRTAYYDGENVKARYNMSIAATLGGLCMVLIPCNIGHCVAEAIGPKYKIAHGIACAIVTPYQMEYNLPACIDRLVLLANCLGEDVHDYSKRVAAYKAINAVKDLIKDLELPTCLKEVKFPKEDMLQLAEYLVKKRQYDYNLPTWNPRKLSLENVTELLSRMWDGY